MAYSAVHRENRDTAGADIGDLKVHRNKRSPERAYQGIAPGKNEWVYYAKTELYSQIIHLKVPLLD